MNSSATKIIAQIQTQLCVHSPRSKFIMGAISYDFMLQTPSTFFSYWTSKVAFFIYYTFTV